MNAIKCCVEDDSEVKCEVFIYPKNVDSSQRPGTRPAKILPSERSPFRCIEVALGELDVLYVGPRAVVPW